MKMATPINQNQLHIEEQIARIRQMIDDSDRARAEATKARADSHAISRNLLFQAMLMAAVLLGAGAAIGTVVFTIIK